MTMTRIQMIKALQERGWGKAFSEELEKCYTYELRRVLLQEERVGGISLNGELISERRRNGQGCGPDSRPFS